MEYLALIQARCGSSRLPGKMLLDLAGAPVIERVVRRVSAATRVDEVAVATSIGKENLPLIAHCAGLGVRVFAGSEDDVLDRMYQAARLFSTRYVVRVTGDCPVYDAALLDQAIASMRPDADYLGMLSESFPDGLDIEIMTFAALERAWKEARRSSEREHVTLYIKNHPALFRLQDFACPEPGLGGLRWTLDEREDYEVLSRVYRHFGGRQDFGYRDVLGYFAAHPQVAALNARYARNEGLAKSIKHDKLLEERG